MIDDQYKMGLMAAEGYLELGMTDDAMREFMNLPREAKFSIEGLTLLMEIHRAEEEWPEMESVAERLWAADPGNVIRWIDWAIASPSSGLALREEEEINQKLRNMFSDSRQLTQEQMVTLRSFLA